MGVSSLGLLTDLMSHCILPGILYIYKEKTQECYPQPRLACAGMLVGPASLGMLTDVMTVRRALAANAAALAVAGAFFAVTAREAQAVRT